MKSIYNMTSNIFTPLSLHFRKITRVGTLHNLYTPMNHEMCRNVRTHALAQIKLDSKQKKQTFQNSKNNKNSQMIIYLTY